MFIGGSSDNSLPCRLYFVPFKEIPNCIRTDMVKVNPEFVEIRARGHLRCVEPRLSKSNTYSMGRAPFS